MGSTIYFYVFFSLEIKEKAFELIRLREKKEKLFTIVVKSSIEII